MQLTSEHKAVAYGLLFAIGLMGIVILFPSRSGEAFTCFAAHLAQKWSSLRGQESGPHFWPLAPWLCAWVVSLIVTGIGSIGLVRLLLRARKERMPLDQAGSYS